MFDEKQVQKIGKGAAAPFNWSSLPTDLLIKYRDEITQQLPALELSKINLEEELLLQFHTIRTLQKDVIDDGDVPVNQRAQVANAVASSLNKLAEMQMGVYTAERFKNVENLLIRVLSKLPEESAAAFLTEYEKLLGNGDG